MRQENVLTIGQLARRAGIGVETVRFYEREGLVACPPRRASGYRQYPMEALRRLRFIRRAKALGFSLQEIGELLGLRVDRRTTCAAVRARAAAKIEAINEKIRELEQVRDALERLARSCHGRGPVSECPLLEEFERGDEELS